MKISAYLSNNFSVFLSDTPILRAGLIDISEKKILLPSKGAEGGQSLGNMSFKKKSFSYALLVLMGAVKNNYILSRPVRQGL